MKREDTGEVARELDEILGVMEKREMERELHRGGAKASEPLKHTAEGDEELIVEDLDGEEDSEPTGKTDGPAGKAGRPVQEVQIPAGKFPQASLLRPVDGLLAAFWIRGDHDHHFYPEGDFSFRGQQLFENGYVPPVRPVLF